jgi:uncharacterized protein (TIGR02996 family)
MAGSPHDGLPIPKGCSLSTPLGASVETLVEIWRATQAEEVVPKLVALSDAYADFFSRLPKKGPLFGRVVDRAPERMLSVLLRAVTHGTDTSAANRLQRIFAACGPDPRIGPFLERWTNVTTYPSGHAFNLTLEEVIHAWEPRRAELRSKATRSITDADRAALAHADALIASLPKRLTARALLNDVYTNPSDIARRQVLSDVLMELGDPWGELIALQCARAQRSDTGPASAPPDSPDSPDSADSRSGASRQREAELLEAGSPTWLGRLAPWVRAGSVVFEGGFPAKLAPVQAARASGLTEWSTVRELVDPRDSRADATIATLNLLPRMPQLRSATILVMTTPRQRPRLRGARGIEHLALHFVTSRIDDERELLAAWAPTAAFPRLERLDFLSHQRATHLLEPALDLVGTPFGRNLRALGFHDSVSTLFERCVPHISIGRMLPILHSLADGSSLELTAPHALTLKIRGRVDMTSLAPTVRRARLTDFRVEAVASAWPAVEARRWQENLGSARLKLVRV